MKLSSNFELVAGDASLSLADLDASNRWIEKMLDAYASKDPDFMAKFYEDNGYFTVNGVEVPVKGLDARNAFYAWMVKGYEGRRPEYALKTVRVLPDQLFFTCEKTIPKASGDIKMVLEMLVRKSVQATKMKSMIVSGETGKMLNAVAAVSGSYQGGL